MLIEDAVDSTRVLAHSVADIVGQEEGYIGPRVGHRGEGLAEGGPREEGEGDNVVEDEDQGEGKDILEGFFHGLEIALRFDSFLFFDVLGRD